MTDTLTGYRGDIQIYRAVAVLQVLLFHMGIAGFSAGFLGVDIFFVISGYLMTMLYTPQSTAGGFYLRRARRLMPAYLATVAATLAAAFIVTVPTDFQQVGEQAQFAAALASNIGFWLHNSYFSKSEFNPLLHLWSLGVECQFYLIFPFLMLLARRFRGALPAIIAVSLASCLAFVMVSPKMSFFMLPMRIWEFGIGMWVAGLARPQDQQRPWGLVGLAGMLVIPLLPVQGEYRNLILGHPGLAAVLTCGATALALHFRLPAAATGSAIGKTAQRLGNVSYSLYLAHWPVLILHHYIPFAGTRSEAGGPSDLLVSTALVAAATAVLYAAFEQPGPRLFTVRRTLAAAALIVLASLVAPAYQLRRFDAVDTHIFAAWTDRSPYRCGKVFRILHPADKLCQIGDGDRGTVLLIGDSHADAIKQAFASTASRYGLRTYFAVDNTPLITPGLDAAWLAGEARARHADAVFLHYATKNLDDEMLERASRALADAGIRLILILPTPEYASHVPQQLYAIRHAGARFAVTDLAGYRHRNAAVLAGVRRLRWGEAIETAPLFCAPVCRVTDPNGRVLYFDEDHLTLHGAAMIVPAIAPVLRQIAHQG